MPRPKNTAPEQKFTSLTPLHNINVDDVKAYRPPRVAEMTNEQRDAAYDQNVIRYPQVEKVWVDPVYQGQNFTAISFVPAPGASADEKGFYGVLKVRGAFGNEIEMKQHCDKLVGDVDSYHTILQARMGYPLPLMENMEELCDKIDEIEVNKNAQEIISKDIRCKVNTDKEEVRELNTRREDIRKQVESEESQDVYITSHVKRAQLIHTTVGLMHQMRQNKRNLLKVIRQIEELEKSNPEYRDTYIQNYKDACVEIGLEPDEIELINNMQQPVPFTMDDLTAQLPESAAIRGRNMDVRKVRDSDLELCKYADALLKDAEFSALGKGLPTGMLPGGEDGDVKTVADDELLKMAV